MSWLLNFKGKLTSRVLAMGSACLAFSLELPAYAQTRTPAKAPATSPQTGIINWALGRADAPVTLVEYASMTCGHCAAFNANVMPTIKRRFVDTGQVRYILRPLPTPPFDLSVAMHALTMCAGPSRYYPLLDAFFDRQQDVFAAASGETGPKGLLFSIAQDAGGLSYAASEACLRDPARQTQVRANAQVGIDAGANSTPTILINGRIVTVPAGERLDESHVVAAINAALARRSAPATKAKKR